MALFTQYKQWIELAASGYSLTEVNKNVTTGGAGIANGARASSSVGTAYKTIGAYFERVSGGEVSYGLAEATPANSRGMLYRSTRWRISELTLEANLTIDEFTMISHAIENFRHDGNGKFAVRRTIHDGEKGFLKHIYSGCSLLSPIAIDDGDVGRDNEVMMMRLRIQPEKLEVWSNGVLVQRFDPFDALDGAYFKGAEGGPGSTPANK